MNIMELLKTRRTYRRFKQQPISDEVLGDMLTAARYASSAANKQPISYVVVRTPEKVKEVFDQTKWAGYFPNDAGRPKAGEEPVLFIGIVENLDISKNRYRCRTGHQQSDTGGLESWRGKLYDRCLQQAKAVRDVWINRESAVTYSSGIWLSVS